MEADAAWALSVAPNDAAAEESVARWTGAVLPSLVSAGEGAGAGSECASCIPPEVVAEVESDTAATATDEIEADADEEPWDESEDEANTEILILAPASLALPPNENENGSEVCALSTSEADNTSFFAC